MGILGRILIGTMEIIFIFGLLPMLGYVMILLWLTPSGEEKALRSWRYKDD